MPLRLCVKKRGSEVLYFRRSDVPLARRAPVPIFEGMRLVWRVLAAALIPIAAVEFYAGGATIPVQHNKTGSNCGVLLLWTRER